MKVLVLGCSGQVGAELMRARWARAKVTGLTRPQFDMTTPETIAATISALQPELVVNAAAYTAVDDAEIDEPNAFAVNAHGPMMLAQECCRHAIPLIHLSTDYVFDGSARRPYRESDPVRPINAYGRSKAAGEAAVRQYLAQHVIVRTAWVYASHGKNFIRTMLRLACERDEVGVVADQFGSPTAAVDIAAAIVQIAGRIAPLQGAHPGAPWGTYHLTAQGETSWYGLAERIFEHLERTGKRRPVLRPITAADYPGQAVRPACSVLDCTLIERAFGLKRPTWQDGLDRVLDELVPAPTAYDRRTTGGTP